MVLAATFRCFIGNTNVVLAIRHPEGRAAEELTG